MALSPYETLAPDLLAFPIGGKIYEIPEIGYLDGLKLLSLIAHADELSEAESADVVWKLAMGSAFEQMKADNVPAGALARAAFCTLTDFQYGREAAERLWETGIDPKVLSEAIQASRAAEAAKPQDRKAKAPATKRSPSTASAPRTRKASTPSTTSRTKSPAKASRS